jgi:putative intracellular protease/amidase
MSRSCGCSRARWSSASAASSGFCPGDIVVIPGGVEHEAWFREDTEVIDFFAPPRDDYSAANRPI